MSDDSDHDVTRVLDVFESDEDAFSDEEGDVVKENRNPVVYCPPQPVLSGRSRTSKFNELSAITEESRISSRASTRRTTSMKDVRQSQSDLSEETEDTQSKNSRASSRKNSLDPSIVLTEDQSFHPISDVERAFSLAAKEAHENNICRPPHDSGCYDNQKREWEPESVHYDISTAKIITNSSEDPMATPKAPSRGRLSNSKAVTSTPLANSRFLPPDCPISEIGNVPEPDIGLTMNVTAQKSISKAGIESLCHRISYNDNSTAVAQKLVAARAKKNQDLKDFVKSLAKALPNVQQDESTMPMPAQLNKLNFTESVVEKKAENSVSKVSVSLAKAVISKSAPPPIGKFPQGTVKGTMMYIGATVGIEVTTGQLVVGFKRQTMQAIKNIGAILREGGFKYKHVVKLTIYLTNLDDLSKVDSVFEQFFKEAPPARDLLQVQRLPHDARISISAIADISEVQN